MRITNEIFEEIRSLKRLGRGRPGKDNDILKARDYAKQYGISVQYVYAIWSGRVRRHDELEEGK